MTETIVLPSPAQLKDIFDKLPDQSNEHDFCTQCHEHMLDCECDDE